MSATKQGTSRRGLWINFWVLMALLVLTVGLSYVDMHGFRAIPSYLIAAVKALLVILFFMEVKFASRLTWVFVGAAFLWLCILIVMIVGDYTTRGWTPSSETPTARRSPPPGADAVP